MPEQFGMSVFTAWYIDPSVARLATRRAKLCGNDASVIQELVLLYKTISTAILVV